MALARFGQDDFSGGAFQGVARHLIPPNGVHTAYNLLLDDDGSLYKRGGAVEFASVAPAPLRFVSSLFLVPGRRVIAANDDSLYAEDGGTLVEQGAISAYVDPPTVAVLGGVAYFSTGEVYAGSVASSDSSTGTIAVTQGSRTVTISGFGSSDIQPGLLLRVAGSGRYYALTSVVGSTWTLNDPMEHATGTGLAYQLVRVGSMASPYVAGSAVAAIGDRLWTAQGRVLRMSKPRDPETGVLRPHEWDDLDFHEMPLGAEIIGLQPQRDVLLVYTTAGLLAVSNVYFDLVDAAGNPQQTLQHLSEDMILWGASGLATWQGAAVVPATDGVWLLPPGGAPLRVSNSIRGRYLEHVEAGRRPGQAVVYRGHYLLPVIDAFGSPVDLLVCRLDRPTADARGAQSWPWSWLGGHDAEVTALTVSKGGADDARDPKLLAAEYGSSYPSGSMVLNCSGFFDQDGPEYDSNTDFPYWELVTRDYATGTGNLNTVRRVQLRYDLHSGPGKVAADVSKGDVLAGSEWTTLDGEADIGTAQDVYTWLTAVRTRSVRFRFRSSGGMSKMVIRGLAFFFRPSNKDR